MTDDRTIVRRFWFDPNSTTTAVSGVAYPTTTHTFDVRAVPLDNDGWKALLQRSNEARDRFEKAKADFKDKYGFLWDPRVKLTSPDAIEDSARIIELRDAATELFAESIATPKK